MAVEGLVVDFGGTRIAFRSPDRAFLKKIEERYSGFLCHEDSCAVELVHDPDEAAFRDRYGWLSHVELGNRRILIGSDVSRGVEVADGAMRMLLPRLVLPDLVLHGAMLNFSGRAVVCCGKPGAGKSTIAKLFPDEACCDELCRLHQTREFFEARSLPFWKARPSRLPLAALFVLEHGTEHRVSSLEIAEAMKEMRKHIYWPLEDSATAEDVFETLGTLVSRVRVFRLAFRPEVSVREYLETALQE